jgi:hypothetical protein
MDSKYGSGARMPTRIRSSNSLSDAQLNSIDIGQTGSVDATQRSLHGFFWVRKTSKN